MNLLARTALYWRALGIATIPIRYRDKRPDGRLLAKTQEGDASWEALTRQLPTVQQILSWFGGELHNLGVVTGWRNLVVIDFDEVGAYLRWELWISRQPGLAPRLADETYKVQTARGVHVYFMTAEKARNAKLVGIDIKASNGYVLAPPSVHPSGAVYSVLQEGFPSPIEALSDVLPAELLLQHTELPAFVASPVRTPVLGDDPWADIDRAGDPSQDLVTHLRGRYRVESFFPNAQKSSKDGRWLLAPCPFHDDRHPSFWIDTYRQICSCHSCRMKPMDAINLFAALYGLTNRDAMFAMIKGAK